MAATLAVWLARPASRVYLAFIWTTLPLLLSQSGLAIGQIARVNAVLQIPAILMFLWTPVVDVKLRRCNWLVFGALATSLLLWVACKFGTSHVGLLTALLFFAGVAVALVPSACGGLMTTMLSAAAQAKASGWNQAGNWTGVGLGGAVVLWLAARFSLPIAGLVAAALVAAIRSASVARPMKSTSKSMAAKSGARRPSRKACLCFGR